LLAAHVLTQHVTERHCRTAAEIKKYFATTKKHNPYKLSQRALKELSEADTEEYYVKPVLKLLGYVLRKDHKDTNKRYPDFWLLTEEPAEVSASYLQRANVGILEAKAYSVDLDIGDGRKELPSMQIVEYIKQNVGSNPHKRWGILTNGYKWRLYSAGSSEQFIEFDLDLALESEDELARFCLVFAPESFVIRESRSSLLDRLREESLSSWTQFSSLIEVRANAILLELVSGFSEEGEKLDNAKHRAYDTLYKMLFALYAESKRLLPIDVSECGIKSLRQLLVDLNPKTSA